MMNHESQPGVIDRSPTRESLLSAAGEQTALAEATGKALGVAVAAVSPCAGGDINRAARLELEDGRRAFLKFRQGAVAREFADEAAGLAWLAEPGALQVPEVLSVVDGQGWAGLALSWIEAGGVLSGDGEEELGHQLAAIHLSGAGRHGVRPPGAEGGEIRFARAVLPAPPAGRPDLSFAELYSIRVEDLARQALEVGALDLAGASTISRLAARIEQFCGPAVPPARLHGDLWSGNVMADRDGRPWIIDPAPYGGHPEVDLAMLELFGSPSRRFYDSYEEVSPLPGGHRNRRRLWQIQPLLVHAVLFGGHYGAAAVRAAAGYTG